MIEKKYFDFLLERLVFSRVGVLCSSLICLWWLLIGFYTLLVICLSVCRITQNLMNPFSWNLIEVWDMGQERRFGADSVKGTDPWFFVFTFYNIVRFFIISVYFSRNNEIMILMGEKNHAYLGKWYLSVQLDWISSATDGLWLRYECHSSFDQDLNVICWNKKKRWCDNLVAVME